MFLKIRDGFIIIQAIFASEIITGVCANVFIIFVILYGFHKKHYLSTSYKILLALCFSNVIYAFVTATNLYITFYWPGIYSVQTHTYIIFSLGSFCFTSCAWLTSCLCIFYFFKIINFSSRFLTQVKMKIDTYVPGLILAVELVSLGSGFSSMSLYIIPISPRNAAVNSSTNGTLGSTDTGQAMLWPSFIPMGIPLMVGFVATFYVFRYIKLHSHRMKAGSIGCDSLKAHQTAANTMLRLLVFCLIMYVALCGFCFGIFPPLSAGNWLVAIINLSFTPVQSFLLIHGNPKLKEACLERIRCRNTAKH
uniref:Taste receptor type 2 n=1 Tax=Leptobrachium leishanense TaxID=445787 RepID=A0A8C5WCV5_9ANUR